MYSSTQYKGNGHIFLNDRPITKSHTKFKYLITNYENYTGKNVKIGSTKKPTLVFL